MGKRKFKWKCKTCKAANFTKETQLTKNFPTDWETVNEVNVRLYCRACNAENIVRVTGLLSNPFTWSLKAISIEEVGGMGSAILGDIPLLLDQVRYLKAQGRIAPWTDIFEKETLLIYQVYIENGELFTRIRGMTSAELGEDIEHQLYQDMDPAVREQMLTDYRSHIKREVDKG